MHFGNLSFAVIHSVWLVLAGCSVPDMTVLGQCSNTKKVNDYEEYILGRRWHLHVDACG